MNKTRLPFVRSSRTTVHAILLKIGSWQVIYWRLEPAPITTNFKMLIEPLLSVARSNSCFRICVSGAHLLNLRPSPSSWRCCGKSTHIIPSCPAPSLAPAVRAASRCQTSVASRSAPHTTRSATWSAANPCRWYPLCPVGQCFKQCL